MLSFKAQVVQTLLINQAVLLQSGKNRQLKTEQEEINKLKLRIKEMARGAMEVRHLKRGKK